VKVVEILIAAVCVGMGVRSLVYWVRRPFEGGDSTDLVLFALFVTGRVAMWFVVGGLFALYAWIGTRGQAFLDDVAQFSWCFLVLVFLAATQLVASFMLGRRTPQG
jgi:hypothetical protein